LQGHGQFASSSCSSPRWYGVKGYQWGKWKRDGRKWARTKVLAHFCDAPHGVSTAWVPLSFLPTYPLIKHKWHCPHPSREGRGECGLRVHGLEGAGMTKGVEMVGRWEKDKPNITVDVGLKLHSHAQFLGVDLSVWVHDYKY